MLPQRVQDAIRLIQDRSLVPSIGDVRLVPEGSPVRPGWLLWDGRTLSRSEYGELFRTVGTRWGSGDGVSTFVVGEAGWAPTGLEYQIRVR